MNSFHVRIMNAAAADFIFLARTTQIVSHYWFLLCAYNTRLHNDPVLTRLVSLSLLTQEERAEIEAINFDESYYHFGLLQLGVCRRTDAWMRKVFYKLTNIEIFESFLQCVEIDMDQPIVRDFMEMMLYLIKE